MSSDSDQHEAAQTVRSAPSYDVGFRRPPMRSRFKRGQSGNPKGRPKGSRNRPPPALPEEGLHAIILKEAYRMVSINDADGTAAIPMVQAVVRSLAVNAAKGSQRAQRLFTELLIATEREDRRQRETALAAAVDYKIAWERELERRKTLGITAPDPLPHPDHIVLDVLTGTVQIRGPVTKEEKAAWDRWEKHRALFEEELKELKALRDDPDCPYRDEILAEIEKSEKVLTIIGKALGGCRRAMQLLEVVVFPEGTDHE
jgi:Family of unknown function (DUF5681)